ncbi:LOW QUALITY PROTEIN: uncharacterized protein Dere_GG26507 [Drosophila erecta]|nr:LOW QUALITY PROTEIN: uncharacterized protein Dere_GG26507 [Drosophila erecta]
MESAVRVPRLYLHECVLKSGHVLREELNAEWISRAAEEEEGEEEPHQQQLRVFGQTVTVTPKTGEVLNRLKRRYDEDSSTEFGPPPKSFKDKYLNEDSRSSCSIPSLKDEDTKGSIESRYFPELGPKENPPNQLLFNLHIERENRREINNNFYGRNYLNL